MLIHLPPHLYLSTTIAGSTVPLLPLHHCMMGKLSVVSRSATSGGSQSASTTRLGPGSVLVKMRACNLFQLRVLAAILFFHCNTPLCNILLWCFWALDHYPRDMDSFLHCLGLVAVQTVVNMVCQKPHRKKMSEPVDCIQRCLFLWGSFDFAYSCLIQLLHCLWWSCTVRFTSSDLHAAFLANSYHSWEGREQWTASRDVCLPDNLRHLTMHAFA